MVSIKKHTKPLTKREIQVLRLIAQGFTTKEISSLLAITSETVYTYRKRIKNKLNVRNCYEAVYQITKLDFI